MLDVKNGCFDFGLFGSVDLVLIFCNMYNWVDLGEV